MLAEAGLTGENNWGIDPDSGSDADLLARLSLADESMWLAPEISRGLADLRAARVITLSD